MGDDDGEGVVQEDDDDKGGGVFEEFVDDIDCVDDDGVDDDDGHEQRVEHNADDDGADVEVEADNSRFDDDDRDNEVDELTKEEVDTDVKEVVGWLIIDVDEDEVGWEDDDEGSELE